MALRYWRGATQVWSSTANWSATPTGATGVAEPASSDDVFVLEGSLDIDAIDRSSVDLASLTIGGNFTGKIKGLQIACSGATRINCVNDVVLLPGTNNIDDLRIYSTGNATVRLSAGAGLVTACQLGQGNLVRESGCTITTMNNAGGTLVDTGGTAYTTLNAYGGTTVTQIGATTANVSSTLVSLGAAAFTTINAFNGTVASINAYGTIATLNLFSGATINDQPVGTRTVGGTQYTGTPMPFTVTNSTAWFGSNLFPNAKVNITYSNATTFVGKTGA